MVRSSTYIWFGGITIALALQAQAEEPTQLALSALQAEIAQEIAHRHVTMPMETVIQRHAIKNTAAFAPSCSKEASAPSPQLPHHRPAGVTPNEWQALLQSSLNLTEVEHCPGAQLTLLDLDEDGQRDLIVDRYVGGTGLFSEIDVYHRSGKRFIARPNNPLYSLNGRGSDQDAQWIRLRNQVYLAYREGEYGNDTLRLSRAFIPNKKGKITALQLDYRYQYQLPQQQTKQQQGKKAKPFRIDTPLHKIIQQTLNQLGHKPPDTDQQLGRCPAPPASGETTEEHWPWFGPGHYTFDIVADFPVRQGHYCHAARLIHFRSSSTQKGQLHLQLQFMRQEDGPLEEWDVLAQRTAHLLRQVRIAPLAKASQ